MNDPGREPVCRGPRCERAGLLLSLERDGAATPDQARELAEHLAECAPCRADRVTDVAVSARLRVVARVGRDAGVPAGFSARVVAAAVASRAAAAAENRFLRIAAAAALFVAITAGGFLATRGHDVPRASERAAGVESARQITRVAVPARLALTR